MVDVPRSSFIPKSSMGMVPDRVRRGRTFHAFNFIAAVLLIGSIISAGLVFFFKGVQESQLESVKIDLNNQKGLFDEAKVREVREFSKQLAVAKTLLTNHISPLRIFSALEEETKQRIQFTSFSLERTSPEEVLVSLSGKTEVFQTLAVQEITFADHVLLKDILFSEVATYDSNGIKNENGEIKNTSTNDEKIERGITFTLTGVVPSTAILYDGSGMRREETVVSTEMSTTTMLEVSSDVTDEESIPEDVQQNNL